MGNMTSFYPAYVMNEVAFCIMSMSSTYKANEIQPSDYKKFVIFNLEKKLNKNYANQEGWKRRNFLAKEKLKRGARESKQPNA